MYLAGVSVRRVEDITEALWGTRVSPSTVSDLNKKIYGTIEAWRNRPIEGEHPYVYLDGIVLKRNWAGEVSTGGVSSPTTRWSASCARSGGAPVSSAHSRTGNQRSISPRPGCAISPALPGRPNAT